MAFRCRRTAWSHNRWGLFLGIVLGLTIHAHTQDLGRCTDEKKQCFQDLEGPSCQACHNTCRSFADGAKASNNEALANEAGKEGWRCLDKCAESNCVENGKKEDNVSEHFRCRVQNHRCYDQYKLTDRNSSAIRKLCGICATTCSNVDRSITMECEARCERINTTCSARSNANTKSPISTPAVPPRETPRSPRPKPAEPEGGSSKLWDWLGPVLGALATIIAAVITVVWVRDYRQLRSGTGKLASGTSTGNGEHDYGWAY